MEMIKSIKVKGSHLVRAGIILKPANSFSAMNNPTLETAKQSNRNTAAEKIRKITTSFVSA